MLKNEKEMKKEVFVFLLFWNIVWINFRYTYKLILKSFFDMFPLEDKSFKNVFINNKSVTSLTENTNIVFSVSKDWFWKLLTQVQRKNKIAAKMCCFFALCELFCYSWCMTLALYLGRYVIQNVEVYRIIGINFNPQVHISRWFEWFILKFSNIFAVALPLSCSHNLRLLRQFWKFELSIYVYETWNLLTIYNNQREL